MLFILLLRSDHSLLTPALSSTRFLVVNAQRCQLWHCKLLPLRSHLTYANVHFKWIYIVRGLPLASMCFLCGSTWVIKDWRHAAKGIKAGGHVNEWNRNDKHATNGNARLVRIQIIYTLSAGDRRRVAKKAPRHQGLASPGACLTARQRQSIVILIV